MKRILVVLLLVLTAGVALPALSQNAFSPDQVKFGPVPPALPAGAQLAVLEGDPMGSSGSFTIRLKMPDGYRIAPHWHPKRENVTIVSEALKLAWGTVSMRRKWTRSRSAASPTLIPACIITEWRWVRRWSRSTEKHVSDQLRQSQ
jgi:hypothetical protein